jgi:hypothetical protein
VTVKLITQKKKKYQVLQQLKVQSVGKNSRVVPLVSNLGIVVQAEALIWSHQVTGLGVVLGFFCPQGKLQLGAEVTPCHFMQGGRAADVFTSWQVYCPTTATLFSQLFSSKVGQFSFEYRTVSQV